MGIPQAKARHASEVRRFIDIPNVGPATTVDFERLGLRTPADAAAAIARALKGKEGSGHAQ